MATRTITRAKAFTDRTPPPHPSHFRAAKDALSRMHRVAGKNENIARCHRCPEGSFCPTCHGLNRARLMLGLIQPKDQGDHKNNILYGMPINRKATPVLRFTNGVSGKTITGRVVQLGNGWRRGIATIDGIVVYEGAKTRDQAEAQAYAEQSITEIREGLKMGLSFDV